ncbi:hypothetical protein IP90_02789 [Luteimonas cucumeris]|uniref:Uncharacterized protein n=1 Tax=Luteimonas cucumeris TaxID=985012 RepID=A0A562KXY3_9GAMM|nr:hypothetical protein [Luteimonas cucumeris]TWI00243.1 hypothetical protein IP90_02789 [Luteimonas cucumeris]
MRIRSLLPGLVLAPFLAMTLAGTTVQAGEPAVSGNYADTSAYLQSDADIDAWFTLVFSLKDGFDQICGDTFCEGEYSNIESLRYRCSVDQDSGRIGMCVWVFAASDEQIDPATGRIAVHRQFWRCRTPLLLGTTIQQLLVALQGDSPLYAPLPGSDKSIFDGLIDCL